MPNTVVVTGATGNVGRPLAEDLLSRGVAVRVVGRSAERLQPLVDKGAEAVVGSVEDAPFVAEALAGAQAAFVMIPPHYTAPDLRGYQSQVARGYAEALGRSKVSHAVTLSSVGADRATGTGPIAGLHDLEQQLNGVEGLNLVHLRAGYFMENFLQSIGTIKSVGVNGGPLKADVSMAMISTRDIAAAAAELLADPRFSGQSARELLGPREYTSEEATRILGGAIGKADLSYVQFPDEETRKAMLGMGLSESMVDAYLEMYGAFNSGAVRPLGGRGAENTTPTPMEDFGKVFAQAYQAS